MWKSMIHLKMIFPVKNAIGSGQIQPFFGQRKAPAAWSPNDGEVELPLPP